MSEPATKIDGGKDSGGAPRIWLPFLVILLACGGLVAVYVTRPGKTGEAPPKRDIAQEARDELKRRNFKPLSESLTALLADTKYDPLPTQSHGLLLKAAPDFTLRDVEGKPWSLAEHIRKGPIVLVFYYGYHCNHCVSQLFALDKDLPKFRELGVQVVAVSADPLETTRERYKQYGAFQFPVLSDPDNKIAEKYEVYTPNQDPNKAGDLLHGTFLIDRHGKIAWANLGSEPFMENRTLLHEAARSEGRLPLLDGKSK